MYYDDQSRRFNVVSGLVFGTALGAGLALLLVPRRPTARLRVGRAAKRARRSASRRLEDARDRAEGITHLARRKFSL